MRQIHWSEVTPQPFLRSPCRDMLTEQGFIATQSAGARNSKVPYELREQVEVRYDVGYVVAYFNKAFVQLHLPTLSEEDFILYAKQWLNPLKAQPEQAPDDDEYQSVYETIHDELSTFAALLPNTGNGSRNPADYPVRWHHAVRFLEKLENICGIEFKGTSITKDQVKAKLEQL